MSKPCRRCYHDKEDHCKDRACNLCDCPQWLNPGYGEKMTGPWWEVWAVEASKQPPAQLLFKFPDQGSVNYAVEQLKRQGATEIKVVQSEEVKE